MRIIRTKSGGEISDVINVTGVQLDTTATEAPEEGKIAWNADDGVPEVGLPGGDVAVQIGMETLIPRRAQNDTGSTISNGDLVYISGGTGNNFQITPADKRAPSTANGTIAMATEDIGNGSQGFVTTFGLVRDIDTDGLTPGALLYLGNDGAFTHNKPSASTSDTIVEIGRVFRAHATEGSVLVNIRKDCFSTLANITDDPTGFVNPEDVIVTGDQTTNTVTLTGTVEAYLRGVLSETFVTGWTSSSLNDVEGLSTDKAYFLLSTDNATATWNDTTTLTETFYKALLIAIAWHDGTNWIFQRECHGLMPWETHREFHDTLSTYKESGGTISGVTLDSTTVADRRPSISETLIYDEDCPSTLPLLAANGPYTQYSLSGASGDPNFDTTALDIVPLSTNQPYWNDYDDTTAGEWDQQLMSNNSYMAIWVLAVPVAADTESQKHRYVFVQGQANDALATIQARTAADVDLGTLGTALPEYVFIGKIIIQYTGGDWEITSVEAIEGTRVSQVVTQQSIPAASAVPFTPAGDLSSTNVQAALEELDRRVGGTSAFEEMLDASEMFAYTIDVDTNVTFAPLNKWTGSNQEHYVRECDEALDSYAYFRKRVPDNIDTTGNVTIEVSLMHEDAITAGTADETVLELYAQAVASGESADVAWGTVVDGPDDVTLTPTATHARTTHDLSFSASGLTAGDMLYLRLATPMNSDAPTDIVTQPVGVEAVHISWPLT